MNDEVITRINVHDKQKDEVLQFSGFSPANLSQHPGFSLEVDAVAKDGQLWVMQFETIHPVRIERQGWAGATEIWLADDMRKLYERHGWERMTSE